VSKKQHIRTIALCVVRQDDRILVNESRDSVKNETFYRPLGGGIEFGERGEDAARREIMEEIGAEITNVRYLGALENIFIYEGKPGHEILLIFEADLVDRSLYDREVIEGELHRKEPIRASWQPLSRFERGDAPLYPPGLLTLLRGRVAESTC
jgi:8-oxo-dGTP pyrophosphatase MutT (NUDIX family)